MVTLAAGPVAWAQTVPAEAVPAARAAPASTAAAQPPATLPTVAIDGHYDNAVGTSDAASQGVVRASLLRSRPALRPGEVLEFVPGIIVTQHSGDGKANQYFLRGFNLDHGTDFATSLDGVPVNLPTHAHGHGYTDLNLLIPELVDRIAYRKGPYAARDGDFSAAGAADIVTRTRLDAPFAAVTLGANGYRRLLGAGSTPLAAGGGTHLLGAVEVQRNDGPWTVPENLRRLNGALTLSGGTPGEGWRAGLTAYDARWTATDQIPQRLVDAGTFDGRPFGRFDSVDPTTGGRTHRVGVNGQWQRSGDASTTRLAAYAFDYGLRLYSNFTYALERPADGDQFAQFDDRRVAGASATQAFTHTLAGRDARSEVGLQLRHDRIRVALHDTVARTITGTVRDDRVRQTQAGLYAQTAVAVAPSLRAVAGLRLDHARFDVDATTQPANGGRASDTIASPKLSLVAGPWASTEFFANAGRGFHSNDARGTTATVDPRTGDPADRVPGLVAARGWELGVRSEWLPGLQTSLALWRLALDSELVYVGDAGATEPNRASRRRGIEWSNRWIPRPWLLVDADLAWTNARFVGADPTGAGDRIPNAVDRVASVAVTLRDIGPWSAGLQWRVLGPGPLVEDDSARSAGSRTVNLRVARRLGPPFDTVFGAGGELTLDVFNLTDRRVDDIAYFYESRLPGEAVAVADRHFHPAEPRTVRLTLRLAF